MTKQTKNCKVESTVGGITFVEVKIHEDIFRREVLSPLIFVIAMMPLKYIFIKCSRACKLTKSQEKINHRMYKVDIKSFIKNEK